MEAALARVRTVDTDGLPIEQALQVLAEVYEAHPRNELLLALIGQTLDRARDVNMLNAPPPEHPLFGDVANALAGMTENARGGELETALLSGLMTASRMMARQADALVERSCQRLIELEPSISHHHYNLGLFLKTRGRFRQGMEANQAARQLEAEPSESTEWNLGICATGAGAGAVALEVWLGLGQKIRMGRFGLPDGGYPSTKVRLAQRPLAERSAQTDDPGLEETIWVERLSPCHGIVRSVLFHSLGVDYGDVVLFDGAPITDHKIGDERVPVFPHLATLLRRQFQFFDFAATQEKSRQIAEVSGDLEGETVVYSHSEMVRTLCARCWRDPDVDHAHDETIERHVVRGRIAAPPELDAGELLRQLDAALSKREPCRLYVPDLCEAAGLADRAAFERRRFRMIAGR